MTREEMIAQIESEMQRRKNPKLITTREQAQAVAEKEDAGGLEAGPWYMDMAKDLLNPIDAVAGIATGGAKAAGQGLRGAAKAVATPLEVAGERQTAINMVKNPAQLEPYARGLVDDAAGKMSERIGSKDQALRELLKGKQGQINPDRVSEIMPNFGAKLAERRTGMVPDGLGGQVLQKLEQGPVDVTGDQLLRIKRTGDGLKNYSFSDSMNPQVVQRAKNASNVSDVARQQIYDIAPGSQELLGEMGKDVRLKNFLTKRASKNPVSTIQTTPGTLKDSVVAQVDEATGSGLRKAGERLQQARTDLFDPSRYFSIEGVIPEVAKTARRGAIATGSFANDGINQMSKVPGLNAAGNAFGYGSAIGVADEMGPSPAPNERPAADRQAMIEQIQAELLRRQGQR